MEENYEQIYKTIYEVFEKLNNSGEEIEAYLVGGICAAIQTKNPLYRKNSNIDIMIDECKLEKLSQILEELGYKFEDERKNKTKNIIDKKGNLHVLSHNSKEISTSDLLSIGLFTFTRKENYVTTYFYEKRENEDNKYIGIECEIPNELFDLRFNNNQIEYAGTKVRTSSIEDIYMRKSQGKREKDIIDTKVLNPFIGEDEKQRISRMQKLEKRIKKYECEYDRKGKVVNKIKKTEFEDRACQLIDLMIEDNLQNITVKDIIKILKENQNIIKIVQGDKDAYLVLANIRNCKFRDKQQLLQVIKEVAHMQIYSETPQKDIEKYIEDFNMQKNNTQLENINEEAEKLLQAKISPKNIKSIFLEKNNLLNRISKTKTQEYIRNMIFTQLGDKNILFENLLEIKDDEQIEEYTDFIYGYKHGQIEVSAEDLYKEEIWKYKYQNTKNPILKFVKGFKHNKITHKNELEDSSTKKCRELLNEYITKEPKIGFDAVNKLKQDLAKGINEYKELKDNVLITNMILTSLKQPIQKINIIDEYNKNKRNLINSNSENINLIEELQNRYDELYEKSNNEEYIRGVTQIFADFMNINLYNDINKESAICLLNSMLLSKGIIPPVIPMKNDERIIETVIDAKDNNYKELEKIIVKRTKEAKKYFEKDNNKKEDKEKCLQNQLSEK